MTPTARVRLTDIVPATAFEMPRRTGIVEWCEEHRRLSPRYSAITGNWKSDVTPYAADIMLAYADPRVRRMTMVFPSQMGKTALLENLVLWQMCCAPTPAMIVLPEAKMRDTFVVERLGATIEASPGIAACLASGGHSKTLKKMDFLGAPLFFALSDSESDLAGRPCGLILADEIDKFPASTRNEGSPLDQAAKRLKTFPRGKFVMASTPTTFQGPIWTNYQESDRSQWCVVDPSGGARMPWEWGRVKWQTRPLDVPHADWGEAVLNGEVPWWYETPGGGRIDTTAELRHLNRGGKWVARRNMREHRGFALNCLASPWLDIKRQIRDWLMAVGDRETTGDVRRLQVFVNHEIGEPYQAKGAKVGTEALAALVGPIPRGTVPAGTTYVTVGVDVQHDGQWWLMLAVDDTRKRMHVVDWGFSRDTVPVTLAKLATSPLTTEDDGQMLPRIVFVDAGDGLMAPMIYNTCRQFGRRPVFPVHGANLDQTRGHYFRLTNGQPEAAHGGRLVLIGADMVKDLVKTNFDNEKVSLPARAAEDKDLMTHLTAEHRDAVRDSRGRVKTRWVCPSGAQNHLGDSLVYAAAGAIVLGYIRNGSWQSEAGEQMGVAAASTGPAQPAAPRPAAPAKRFIVRG